MTKKTCVPKKGRAEKIITDLLKINELDKLNDFLLRKLIKLQKA